MELFRNDVPVLIDYLKNGELTFHLSHPLLWFVYLWLALVILHVDFRSNQQIYLNLPSFSEILAERTKSQLIRKFA